MLRPRLPHATRDNSRVLAPAVRALRPSQWSKNVFVLAPLVFAHELGDPRLVGRALLAFLLFCATSSAVYLCNDIIDRDKDRLHPHKRHRPLAAGTLSITAAALSAAALATGSTVLAWWLEPRFFLFLLAYVVVNLAYSLALKRVVILDVMTLSVGFVLRVLAGAAAVGVAVSAWLVLCTTFLALFLAFSKRRHELLLLSEDAAKQREVLSHYSPAFLDQMINVVSASSLIAYAMYAVADETIEKFGTDRLLWTVPFVLFGIFRYLYLVYQVPPHRVHAPRSPTEALLGDLPFLANFVLWAATAIWIIYLRPTP
jgi:4-hydroxybenzoate polyprenyltransferase